jgi:hypothetical protein
MIEKLDFRPVDPQNLDHKIWFPFMLEYDGIFNYHITTENCKMLNRSLGPDRIGFNPSTSPYKIG